VMDDEVRLGGQWGLLPVDQLAAHLQRCAPHLKTEYLYIKDEQHLKALIDSLPSRMKDDFCWSLCFRRQFYSDCCFQGLLPICSELTSDLYILLPKLHVLRCVLKFDQLHVSKRIKRKFSKFRLTVNSSFDKVMAGCIAQHGEAWLYPPMRKLLTSMHQKSDDFPVKVISFELWDSSDVLCAGELGCVVGAVYTSFTGFHAKEIDSAGTVQLLKTGMHLEKVGFSFWDLGQSCEYKAKVGAKDVPRQEFLTMFRTARNLPRPNYLDIAPA